MSSCLPLSILVVDDERKLVDRLSTRLSHEGYDVDTALDGVQASERAARHHYGLIILDLGLPGKSGLEVLSDLRTNDDNTPVLILSGQQSVEDRVLGLRLGADDYMTKPFDQGELVARVEALLRRAAGVRTVLSCADLSLDLVTRKVERGGRSIELSTRQFELLEFLIRNKNQVLTRKRIAEQVWGYKFETGTNIVGVYISYLRKAIDDDFAKKLIHTVFGAGFMMKDG